MITRLSVLGLPKKVILSIIFENPEIQLAYYMSKAGRIGIF